MPDGKLSKIPDYEKNELRPNQRNPSERDGEGRDVLRYAQENMMVGAFGDQTQPSSAPASAEFTPGLPKPSKSRSGPEGEETIIFGFPRVD